MFWLDCSIIWTCLPKESTCATQCSNAARLPQQREAVARRQGVCLSDPQIRRAEYERCLHNRCLKVDLMQMDKLTSLQIQMNTLQMWSNMLSRFLPQGKEHEMHVLLQFHLWLLRFLKLIEHYYYNLFLGNLLVYILISTKEFSKFLASSP